jgi:hypothetical protein
LRKGNGTFPVRDDGDLVDHRVEEVAVVRDDEHGAVVLLADLERLSLLMAQTRDLHDAEGVRDLAYKLSVMLPYYEVAANMEEGNATAAKCYGAR